MKFRTIIETFTDATEVADNERTVKTEFSVILNGYLLPKSYNDLITTQKYLSPKRMIMKEELMWRNPMKFIFNNIYSRRKVLSRRNI